MLLLSLTFVCIAIAIQQALWLTKRSSLSALSSARLPVNSLSCLLGVPYKVSVAVVSSFRKQDDNAHMLTCLTRHHNHHSGYILRYCASEAATKVLRHGTWCVVYRQHRWPCGWWFSNRERIVALVSWNIAHLRLNYVDVVLQVLPHQLSLLWYWVLCCSILCTHECHNATHHYTKIEADGLDRRVPLHRQLHNFPRRSLLWWYSTPLGIGHYTRTFDRRSGRHCFLPWLADVQKVTQLITDITLLQLVRHLCLLLCHNKRPCCR